mmetsp:Transcript_19335/g.28453  ORF Transcript_19335/g.28453 Transcript_19335/m.28453 type:complete len:165 (-) Transcript_19335:418-912(-)
MGKKSRKIKGSNAAPPKQQQQQQQPPPQASPSPAAVPIYYPSDGPSDVELLQTTSTSLQSKLNQLTELGLANDRASFVSAFVPLDLPPSDTAAYLEDLTSAPEADGQWTNLVAEIAAIRCGQGVDRIEGDQMSKAVFFFTHPLLEKCDREVAFTCVNGEWRAEG